MRPGSTSCTATCISGRLGRNYSELAASWMWVIALAGLALWVMRRREN